MSVAELKVSFFAAVGCTKWPSTVGPCDVKLRFHSDVRKFKHEHKDTINRPLAPFRNIHAGNKMTAM